MKQVMKKEKKEPNIDWVFEMLGWKRLKKK